VIAVVAALAWLVAGQRNDLRTFDPKQVARLEQEMWRSYYEHRRLALFGQLFSLLREQYGLSPMRACVTAAHAARAAVVFQRGRNRQDYELALGDLRAYYRGVLDRGEDIDRASRLELEWWIVHRERDRYSSADLERSLAELQSAIYKLPPASFAEHARWRAEAMHACDRAVNPTAAEWFAIRAQLERSWTALWNELHSVRKVDVSEHLRPVRVVDSVSIPRPGRMRVDLLASGV